MKNQKDKREENAFVGFMFIGMGLGFLARALLTTSE